MWFDWRNRKPQSTIIFITVESLITITNAVLFPQKWFLSRNVLLYYKMLILNFCSRVLFLMWVSLISLYGCHVLSVFTYINSVVHSISIRGYVTFYFVVLLHYKFKYSRIYLIQNINLELPRVRHRNHIKFSPDKHILYLIDSNW